MPHTEPLQLSVPQHWDDDEQEPPLSVQPLRPVQVPPEHVSVPQQSEPFVHFVPALWQAPLLQTLLVLQRRVPQQSPLVLQTLLLSWQGPVCEPPGMELVSTPPLPPQAPSAITEHSKAEKARTWRGGSFP